MLVVWISGNTIVHHVKVTLYWAQLVLRCVMTLLQMNHCNIYTSHSGQLSLAIPPWIGTLSIGDGPGYG